MGVRKRVQLMPGERRPRRWAAAGSGSGSSASPSNTRRFGPGSPDTNTTQQQQQQPQQQQRQQKRWGSNLSIQRRERTVVWASCLQKVQALRQGGSWQRPESGVATANALPAGGSLVDGGSDSCSTAAATALAQHQQDGEKLNDQLDILATLTYPNSSIRYAEVFCLLHIAVLLYCCTSWNSSTCMGRWSSTRGSIAYNLA